MAAYSFMAVATAHRGVDLRNSVPSTRTRSSTSTTHPMEQTWTSPQTASPLLVDSPSPRSRTSWRIQPCRTSHSSSIFKNLNANPLPQKTSRWRSTGSVIVHRLLQLLRHLPHLHLHPRPRLVPQSSRRSHKSRSQGGFHLGVSTASAT